jgi:hypothetical protein
MTQRHFQGGGGGVIRRIISPVMTRFSTRGSVLCTGTCPKNAPARPPRGLTSPRRRLVPWGNCIPRGKRPTAPLSGRIPRWTPRPRTTRKRQRRRLSDRLWTGSCATPPVTDEDRTAIAVPYQKMHLFDPLGQRIWQNYSSLKLFWVRPEIIFGKIIATAITLRWTLSLTLMIFYRRGYHGPETDSQPYPW